MPAVRPRRYRLLVFDWDGTVMDSIGTIVACTLATLGDLGISGVAPERIRDTIGLGLADVFDRLQPTASAADRERIVERYRHHWIGTYARQSVPVPGVVRVLEDLAADYRLAIATGKSRTGLDRDLAATGLGARFVATRTVSEAPSKPHPGMLRDLMAVAGVATRETLMIGDTTHDLEMARAAGCPSVGVLTGSHRRAELLDAGALACLDSVCDLPRWLAGDD